MLGERIAALRKKKKLTQQEISDKLHISRATYAQYEIDRRVPEYLTLEKLADFFEVSIDYLVGRTDEMQGQTKDSIDKLIEYLEMALSNDEIKERMVFQVGDIVLDDGEADEYLTFIKLKRAMKKQQLAGLSNSKDI